MTNSRSLNFAAGAVVIGIMTGMLMIYQASSPSASRATTRRPTSSPSASRATTRRSMRVSSRLRAYEQDCNHAFIGAVCAMAEGQS
ncbi:uncharacterized protein BO72DRAFT_176675 [Aspergillus fijiensis CBS 313.89]|uniref:Uncharacterized protein n=1 Tax=Aspergillus fijiensis CBS 313.89 TaxID=1448319 RepID=A0A8G1W5X8_9EURO|nr:uncharacterized protein BO72DRAFT_176675 [Aspergillus fijiensis CBS 313.89]RAK81694.1 hypothetical protein BO72DRAFT_176675 [Aspergillus fijiensis CBS 313.89]